VRSRTKSGGLRRGPTGRTTTSACLRFRRRRGREPETSRGHERRGGTPRGRGKQDGDAHSWEKGWPRGHARQGFGLNSLPKPIGRRRGRTSRVRRGGWGGRGDKESYRGQLETRGIEALGSGSKPRRRRHAPHERNWKRGGSGNTLIRRIGRNTSQQRSWKTMRMMERRRAPDTRRDSFTRLEMPGACEKRKEKRNGSEG